MRGSHRAFISELSMQKVTAEPHARQKAPRGRPAAFLSTVLSYIKQARIACKGTRVHGTTCIQRLLFHTTIYSTKHLCDCQEEKPSANGFLCKKRGRHPAADAALWQFIPDTFCAGASDAPGSGHIPFPDSSRRCQTAPGSRPAQREPFPSAHPPSRRSAF